MKKTIFFLNKISIEKSVQTKNTLLLHIILLLSYYNPINNLTQKNSFILEKLKKFTKKIRPTLKGIYI